METTMRYIPLLMILCCGCLPPAKIDERIEATDNSAYEVTLLFTTNSGVKVYRFYDGGYVYFTEKGNTRWDQVITDGEDTKRIPLQSFNIDNL